MRMFIDVILNWDVRTNSARKMPGLFGHTRAFFAATESQGSTGSLHTHMLVWIQNMPSSVDEYYSMCKAMGFRDALIKYVDSIATSNVPVSLENCPHCVSPTLEAQKFPQNAFKKPKVNARRPTMVACTGCGDTFGASELIVKHLERLESVHGEVNCGTEIAQKFVVGPQPLPCSDNPASPEAVICSRALLLYQHHHWFHSGSCFKVTKRTPKGDVCRMFMPKESSRSSFWTDDDRIQMKRYPGKRIY